ncbi:MAG: glucosaminidase domain-containing protein [Rhodospirillaceae bacterium]|nr:glucosaminidase domain-containing protein [Rhodospirillaceae bacterium]
MTKRSNAVRADARSGADDRAGAWRNAAWAAFSLLVLGAAGAFGAGYDPFKDALEDRYNLSVFVRITPDNTFVRPNPAPPPPVALILIDNSVKQLSAALELRDFTLSAVRRGAPVPRVFVASLPEDIDQIRTVQEKRDTFIRAVLPMILSVNEQIASERKYLLDLHRRVQANENLPEADTIWLKAISERYKVPIKRGKFDWTELLLRVDTVPASLALAQSIVETGWGASAPARRSNALFGMIGGDGTDTSKLAAFDTPYASVAAYVRNLNTFAAYIDFRRQRAALRMEGKEPDGHALATTLLRYSELGIDYTRHIQMIIEKERLKPFDGALLITERDSQS